MYYTLSRQYTSTLYSSYARKAVSKGWKVFKIHVLSLSLSLSRSLLQYEQNAIERPKPKESIVEGINNNRLRQTW